MQSVRLGIVGAGNMGFAHARLIRDIETLELCALADSDPVRLARAADKFSVPAFDNAQSLLKSGLCDAVLICTPHFDHTTVGIAALKAGLHVLVEKPISAHKADCEKLIRAHKRPDQVFAAMFNQRTDGYYRLIREMVQSGELGEIRRVHWTITDWFRSQAYYDSGGWRATWSGEGGGVLLNQCPHQLDLLQWIFGMPEVVSAQAGFGKYHRIEVEDEVTAVLNFPGGATGVFVTSTGEAPGVNRLEVAAENGLLVFDTRNDFIEWQRNDKPVSRAIAENRGFEKPSLEVDQLKPAEKGRQHAEVLENFADAVLHGAPLIAPAAEGLASVELANAMLLSAHRGKPVQVPISARAYASQLKKLIAASDLSKDKTTAGEIEDLTDTYSGGAGR